MSARNLFYLARTYEALERFEEAIYYFKLRSKLKGYDQEDFYAKYSLGKLTAKLAQTNNAYTWDMALSHYLEAYDMRPERAEPLVRISEYYIDNNLWQLGYVFAKKACEIADTQDTLFVEKYAYDYTRYNLLGASACYRSNDCALAAQVVQRLIKTYPYMNHLYGNLDRHISSLEAQEKVDYKPIVVVIPSYNNKIWYQKNLDSVFNQKYPANKIKIMYIDDASPDGTGSLVEDYIKQKGWSDRCIVIKNLERQGALANIYKAVHFCDPRSIVVNLDGDDWLSDDGVLSYVNFAYQDPEVWMTYGQFRYWPSGDHGWGAEIEDTVIEENSFRRENFTATALRTFYAGLFQKIDREDILYNGAYYSMGWDFAIMFPVLEMAGKHSRFISRVLYEYNLSNPINDHDINRDLQFALGLSVRQKRSYKPLEKLFD